MRAQSLSHVWLFATPWTVALQAPLSMGFSRHEYWSVDSQSLLQGIFLTLGNLTHVSCTGRQILYPSATWEALVHQGERELGSGEVTVFPPHLAVEHSSELRDTVQHLERSCAPSGEYG